MTASRWTWVAALGSLIVVVALAVSAAGLLPTNVPSARAASSNAPGPSWGNWSGNATTYGVTFTESGLPNGTLWFVVVHDSWGSPFGWGGWSGFHANWSTNSSLGFQLRNGTYDFYVGSYGANGTVYSASPRGGNFTVNGTSTSVAVTFSAVTFYTLSFTETGLPNGTFWTVHLAGGMFVPFSPTGVGSLSWGRGGWNGSATSTINYTVPNGNYPYGIGPAYAGGVTYLPTPSSGNVTINGSSATVSVSFAPLTYYNVSFVETGLPNGSYWSVGVHGGWGGYGHGQSTNGTAITVALPNGTYPFSVPAVWTSAGIYTATPSSGNVTVNGTSVSVAISFAPLVLYSVSFQETGLPNGTFWSVALFGTGWGGFSWNGSAGATVNFSAPNGTYPYAIGSVWSAGGLYAPTTASRNVTVNGSAVVVDVTFASVPLYNVTFSETGLPNGTAWSVAVYGPGTFVWNGTTNSSLTLALPNGTYSFSVGWAWSGGTLYTATPSSGTVTVAGAATSVSVTYS